MISPSLFQLFFPYQQNESNFTRDKYILFTYAYECENNADFKFENEKNVQ